MLILHLKNKRDKDTRIENDSRFRIAYYLCFTMYFHALLGYLKAREELVVFSID